MTIRRRRPPSARRRILGWYVMLLGVALIASLLLQRTLLLSQVTAEVDQAIDQEVGELRSLAQGNDPTTGEPFGGDAAAIFTTFLQRNVGIEGESIITFIGGELYQADLAGAELAQTELVSEWAAVTRPTRREVQLDDRTIRYLAVPLLHQDRQVGTFISAVDVGARLDRVEQVVRLGALVYGSVFLLASALAWVAAGGVLRPLREVTGAARSISETDLSRRIPVEGKDEVAELSRTFNDMLDRLEQAFQAQRRFVDDAGHELRTPITVIRGNLELLSGDPAERAHTVRLVTDELDRMARIVDDLLVLAKAEQPDFVEAHPFDVAEFTQELATKGAMLDGRSWAIDDQAHVVMVGDRQRLTQAMMNLMRNAIEHSGPEVAVALGSRSAGNELRLWVRDEGPGIAPEDRDRLFERFARGKRGRRTTGGAGLGLAIVRAIAEAHGGTVELESSPGEGSRFTLTVPLQPGAQS
ncbi:MAG TPA: HAMP domain-containing sensor histidine kinase [Acidimicrobiia bacterium]|nr:HAMP domain-containing sensor histidine kinase [Acidimicrobiia bacterium]